MGSIDSLTSFILATMVFTCVPGPAMLYTAAQTMARGRRGGLMAALGLNLGGYAHVIAAAFGLSAVFHYVPELFYAVKFCGAAYLVWLGIGMIRTKNFAGLQEIEQKGARRAMLQSISVELLNPKTAVFFIAFLPQFVDPAAAYPVWLQFLILGVVVNVAFSISDLIIIMFTTIITKRLQENSRLALVMRWLGGSILIGIGTHLALDRS